MHTQDLFSEYDADASGSISFDELATGLQKQGYVINEAEVGTWLTFCWTFVSACNALCAAPCLPPAGASLAEHINKGEVGATQLDYA